MVEQAFFTIDLYVIHGGMISQLFEIVSLQKSNSADIPSFVIC